MSILTVTTTSTGTQLTTLAALKSHLGVTATSMDAELQDAVDEASDAVTAYVGYPLLRQRYQETVPGYGNLRLLLSRTPVLSVGSIYVGNQLVDPTSYDVEDPTSGKVYRELGWPWSAGIEWDLTAHVVPKSELARFDVDYEAGWVLSSACTTVGFITTTQGRTLPRDVERATLDTAKSFYLGRRRDGDIVSKKVGDLSITYRANGDTPAAVPPEAQGLLSKYVRYK